MKHSDKLTETPITGISGDRRSKRRFPINLPVSYQIVKNRLVTGSGGGRMLDISSQGIAFTPDSDVLQTGNYVKLSVSWPLLLNETCALKLVAQGRVVRSVPGCTAVRIGRYEFRTERTKAPESVA